MGIGEKMKKILFVNPCLRQNAKSKYPPVGLAHILTAVEKEHIAFDLIDMDAYDMSVDELRDKLSFQKYDIYAFGCIVSSFRIAKEIASVIRNVNPDAFIIVGNSVASSIPELFLRNTEVDVAVIGEGDVTIVDLLNCLNTNGEIGEVAGIAFLRDGSFVRTPSRDLIASLDEIGFPNWDLFDIELYNVNRSRLTVDKSENQVVYPLNAARGCPFSCTFCYHVFKGQPYRKYSEDIVLEEFKRLYSKYNATFIQFWDELTFPNIKSVERMVDKLEGLSFSVGWEGITRGDLFKKEHVQLLRRMKSAGCKSIAFSIENASPEILAAMNKKINVEDLVEHSLSISESGIIPLTSIIFGYPQETLESIKMTLDLCEKCNIYPSVGFLQPLPGTPIYDWAVGEGFITNEIDYLMQAGDRQDFHVNLTKIPTNEFVDAVTMGLNDLASKMGLKFENPLKTGVYQKSKKETLS